MIDSDCRDFFKSLSPEDRLLLDLRDELYDGSWKEMETDLQDRLAGRPYVFRLINRIEDDLQRIRRLGGFEQRHGIDLRKIAEAIEDESRAGEDASASADTGAA